MAQAQSLDFAAEEFARGGVGELDLGPAEGAADVLVLGEVWFALRDCGLQGCVIAGEEDHADGLDVACDFAGDYGAASDAGLLEQRGFEVGGVDVEAAGGDDGVALATEEAEVAVLGSVRRGRRWRATRLRGVALAALPGGGGDHVAADEDLAGVAEADLAAGEGFADGAFADAEGVVEGDERGGFGHAVALDEGEAELIPEALQLVWQGGSAGDDGPELQSEELMNLAEAPPAFLDGRAGGALQFSGE